MSNINSLIALGLRNFSGTLDPYQLISSYLVLKKPWKLRRRVWEMSGAKAPANNPIKVFRESEVLPAMPLACKAAGPTEECAPVQRETSSMPEWLKKSQPVIQKAMLSSSEASYPSWLPRETQLRLHPSQPPTVTKQHPHPIKPKQHFSLAHSTRLPPLITANRQSISQQPCMSASTPSLPAIRPSTPMEQETTPSLPAIRPSTPIQQETPQTPVHRDILTPHTPVQRDNVLVKTSHTADQSTQPAYQMAPLAIVFPVLNHSPLLPALPLVNQTNPLYAFLLAPSFHCVLLDPMSFLIIVFSLSSPHCAVPQHPQPVEEERRGEEEERCILEEQGRRGMREEERRGMKEEERRDMKEEEKRGMKEEERRNMEEEERRNMEEERRGMKEQERKREEVMMGRVEEREMRVETKMERKMDRGGERRKMTLTI
ncbi:GON-4-like protein [Merluccius polli]|uniref:GON-4-like protein n=1 Tax=Merluccius polli TaxID=89951 RepID=A0AA47P932_MERPO|nr:GON-4-like protein [Merluccius polli]